MIRRHTGSGLVVAATAALPATALAPAPARAVHAALVPGERVLIHNLSPAPSKPEEPYRPWTDGRCPFPPTLFERID